MANIYDQFDTGTPPVTGNPYDQFDAAPSFGQAVGKVWQNPTAPVSGQITLPGIGAPSLIGMAKSLWEGATLPGDVYAGRVDPASEEAQKRLPGLAGTAMLGATGAPTGALGSGMVRPAAAIKAAETVTPQELAKAGQAGIKEANRSLTAVDPRAALDYVAQARTALANDSKPRSLASGVHSTLDELEASAENAIAAGQPLSANDMVGFRGTMTGWQKTPTPNSAAAGIAKSEFDDWLKQTSPSLAELMKEYTANFRAAHLGADIASPVNRAILRGEAANSGMNIENPIRSSFASTLAKEADREMRGRATKFTPEVRQMMASIGTPGANLNRAAGNLLGGGGGMLASIYGLGGIMAHPGLAIAPLVGAGLKTMGNRAAIKKADAVAQAVMAAAPYARQKRANPIPVTPKTIGGLLGLIARNPQLLLSLPTTRERQ